MTDRGRVSTTGHFGRVVDGFCGVGQYKFFDFKIEIPQAINDPLRLVRTLV